ncbi:hypothetical protein RDV84_18705 [Lysobacter yananisis]|uniref:Uncharacterized protein n=1 Tax=Lysobacter yananisis TaxID=1003114 RepID=A0ABY9P7H0_9GAMM|nr:hypothetical protein [Lysobacter yananisis]WMT01975.1 hypothetical protein RDV84_18705 [Lysobacter yananisis]
MDANDGEAFRFCPCGEEATIRREIQGLSLLVTCTRCGMAAATTRPDLARIVAMRHRLSLAPQHRNAADTLRAAACLAAESGQAARDLLRALREDGALAELTAIEAERYAQALARSGLEARIEPPPYALD